MSTYKKAQLLFLTYFLSIPVFFGITVLTAILFPALAIIPGLLMFAVPVGAFLTAQKWPPCPACGQKVFEYSPTRDGVKLDSPAPECGYCGHDLTQKPASD